MVQLAITLFMTGVRSWVRRGLATEPPHIVLNSGHELDEAAIYLGLFGPSDSSDKSPFGPTSELVNGWWEIVTGGYRGYPGDPSPLPRWVHPRRDGEEQLLRVHAYGGVRRFRPDPVVSIRQDLQSYMPDASPIHEIASALERTIKRIIIAFDEAVIIDALKPTQTSQDYRQFQWSHLVSRSGESRSTPPELFEIPLSCTAYVGSRSNRNNERECETPDELYPILSLWIYSLKTRNLGWADRLGGASEYTTRPQNASDYIRLIGRCDDLDTGNLRALPAWIGRWILLFPEPDGQSIFSSRVYGRAPTWPVFGYENLFDNRYASPPILSQKHILIKNRDNASSRGMSHKSHLYDDLKGAFFLPERTDGRTKSKPDSRMGLSETHIAILSHHAMPTQCALEMLSGFMNAVASEVQSLGGRTSFEAVDDASLAQANDVFEFADIRCHNEPMTLGVYYEYDGDRWTNSVLLSFSRILVETGLVRNLEEANAIVIPPFAKRGLLPTEEGVVRFEPSLTESRTTSENPIDETKSISSHQSWPPGGDMGIKTPLSIQKNGENGDKHPENPEPKVVATEVVGREEAESSSSGMSPTHYYFHALLIG